MIRIIEPWDCLLNGPTLQLEPLAVRGGFRVRRKDGGAVVGQVHAHETDRAVLHAGPETARRDAAEVLQILLPWLGGRATLEARLSRPAAGTARRLRTLRLRRQGLARRLEPGAALWLQHLGIAGDYGTRIGVDEQPEPTLLHPVGEDRLGRRHWLVAEAARAWQGMRAAASTDGVQLEIVSGFRSMAYQAAIFRRKRERGQSLQQILTVNAAPGYSEHHSGCALDLTAPGCAPADEAFEQTEAFRWLQQHAGGHGFTMSYPRNNPQGFVHEPWHWRWRPG